MQMLRGRGRNNIGNKDIDKKRLGGFKAIISPMPKKDRENPEIVKSTRRRRISAGSGTTIQDVNQLLKQFEQTRDLMRKLKNNKGRLPF